MARASPDSWSRNSGNLPWSARRWLVEVCSLCVRPRSPRWYAFRRKTSALWTAAYNWDRINIVIDCTSNDIACPRRITENRPRATFEWFWSPFPVRCTRNWNASAALWVWSDSPDFRRWPWMIPSPCPVLCLWWPVDERTEPLSRTTAGFGNVLFTNSPWPKWTGLDRGLWRRDRVAGEMFSSGSRWTVSVYGS